MCFACDVMFRSDKNDVGDDHLQLMMLATMLFLILFFPILKLFKL